MTPYIETCEVRTTKSCRDMKYYPQFQPPVFHHMNKVILETVISSLSGYMFETFLREISVWVHLRKLSKIGNGQKTLIPAFAYILTVIAKNYFLEGRFPCISTQL